MYDTSQLQADLDAAQITADASTIYAWISRASEVYIQARATNNYHDLKTIMDPDMAIRTAGLDQHTDRNAIAGLGSTTHHSNCDPRVNLISMAPVGEECEIRAIVEYWINGHMIGKERWIVRTSGKQMLLGTCENCGGDLAGSVQKCSWCGKAQPVDDTIRVTGITPT